MTEKAQPCVQGQGGPLPSQGQSLEAVKGEDTAARLAGRYQAQVPGPSQPDSGLEKALSAGAAGVFSNGQEQKASSDAALIARLYQEIGHTRRAGKDPQVVGQPWEIAIPK